MPQIEQNMYLNALDQAKSDIVHRINMRTIYPLPYASSNLQNNLHRYK